MYKLKNMNIKMNFSIYIYTHVYTDHFQQAKIIARSEQQQAILYICAQSRGKS